MIDIICKHCVFLVIGKQILMDGKQDGGINYDRER